MPALTILTPRRRVEMVEHFRGFDYRGQVGWGFSFPSDDTGHVNVEDVVERNRHKLAEPLFAADRTRLLEELQALRTLSVEVK